MCHSTDTRRTYFSYLPWSLTIPLDNSRLDPLATVLVGSVLFVGIALWVFERQEL